MKTTAQCIHFEAVNRGLHYRYGQEDLEPSFRLTILTPSFQPLEYTMPFPPLIPGDRRKKKPAIF